MASGQRMVQTKVLALPPANKISEIEGIAKECSLEAIAGQSDFQRAFTMAKGVGMLRAAVTDDIVEQLMQLQGTSLGFRTDKDQGGGYHRDAVKECAIECALRGGIWVGNEFNIIAGRCYMTKEFFTRKLREFPGLTDLRLMPGVPIMVGGGALVAFVATWNLDGKPHMLERNIVKHGDGTLDCRIPVKVNNGMGTDAILGKAERKMLAAIYKQLTGSEVGDGEADDEALKRQRLTIDDYTARAPIDHPPQITPEHDPPPPYSEALAADWLGAAKTLEELDAAANALDALEGADRAAIGGMYDSYKAKLKGQN